MKKILIIAVMVAATGSVFARGNQEEAVRDSDEYGRGPRSEVSRGRDDRGRFDRDGRDFRGQGEICRVDEEGNPVTPETVELEGALVLEEGTMPYLEQNGEKVFLMVPPFAIDSIGLEGGESVKVSGFELPEEARTPWRDSDSSSVYLHVVSAEIDGETLTLEYGRSPRDRMIAKGSRGRSGGRRPGRA